jgi:hypothetical protein
VCGILLALFKHKSVLDRFLIGWAAAVLVYGILFPAELYNNNFSQMPFLGAVCIAAAYTVSFVAGEFHSKLRQESLLPLCVVVAALVIIFARPFLIRMYSTVFWGVDVAGESLREFTRPDERIFLYGHPQGNGIARYAQRFMGWPTEPGLEEFKRLEEKFKVRFVCIYPGEYFQFLAREHPEISDHIRSTYRVREVGLIENPNRLGYVILEKGEADKTMEEILESITGVPEPRSIYRVMGRLIFFYTIRPDADKE